MQSAIGGMARRLWCSKHAFRLFHCALSRKATSNRRFTEVRAPVSAGWPPAAAGQTAASVSESPASSADHNNTPSTSYGTQVDSGFPTLQLNLPTPGSIRVKTAVFVKSSVKTGDCPAEQHPEFAVVGRSNVGKSSLINLLTNSRSLAMVSKEPGKTRCINHFLINNSWYLVDLPGYGYAKTGKETRQLFDQFTKLYFLQRRTLAMVLLLVDCSIPPTAADLKYAAWLAERGVPFTLVFTKADKRKRGGPKRDENIAAFRRALVEEQGFALLPPSLVTSAEDGLGKGELLHFIGGVRELFLQRGDRNEGGGSSSGSSSGSAIAPS